MRLPFILAAALCFSSTPALAQVGPARLMAPESARHVGLERMWFTHLNFDRGRGRVAGLHLHVSGAEAHTVFQIVYEGQRHVFSQHDRNAFREVIGVEGAKAQAEEKLAQIKAELDKVGKSDVQPPAVETHVIPKITIYATSQLGTVHAIDAETGRSRWATSVGNPLLPTTAPAANDKYVAVCNGSTLYILLATDGSLVWSRVCVGAPGAGPALSDELVFVPMLGGQVETLWLDDLSRPAAIFKSFGSAMVQPAMSLNSVAWPTDLGNLYVGLAHEPGMRFRIEAREAIDAAPAFLAPNKLFATSRDGYIYCVNEQRGNVLWRFTAGEPISHAPVALGSTAYAITERGNLFAINVETGHDLNEELKEERRQQATTPAEFAAADRLKAWPIPGIRSYVAGNEKRLYFLDNRGNVVIIHPRDGTRLGTLAAGQADVPLLNSQTDRIILVSSGGLVQCFRETNLPFPVVHYLIEAKKAPQLPKRAPSLSTSTPDQPLTPPTTTDALTTDPFATPGAKPAAPPATTDDPFAPTTPPR